MIKIKNIRRNIKKNIEKKNHDAILQYNKKYYEENKERCAQYFQENKEKINKVRVLFRHNNHDKKLIQNLRSRVRQMIHDIAIQFEVTTSEYKKKIEHKGFRKLLDCDQDFFVSWIEYQFDENMSWDNHGTYWHADHVYPCGKIDINNEDQRKMCFCWKNLQPLEKSENLSKSNKIDNELINKQKMKSDEFETNYKRHFQTAGTSLELILPPLYGNI